MVRISAIFHRLLHGAHRRLGRRGAVFSLRLLGHRFGSDRRSAILYRLAIYNAIAGRKRDRAEVSDQVSSIARGSGDLARQVAEFGRRLGVDGKPDRDGGRTKRSADAQPLAAEIEELSRLVRQLAESVARHELTLGRTAQPERAPQRSADPAIAVPAANPTARSAEPIRRSRTQIAAFAGLDRDAVVALVPQRDRANRGSTFTSSRSSPCRSARCAITRRCRGSMPATAKSSPRRISSRLPKPVRCCRSSTALSVSALRAGGAAAVAQEPRHRPVLQRFAAATLTDAGFPQLLEFLEANRAIAPSLVFEFTQSAVRGMGPMEHEALAAIAERGFRFSMDNLDRPSRRAARTDGARLPLHQGAGGAAAQPGRRRHEQYPSGRFLRPARPLRHRSDRRADRERGDGGRSARLRRPLRPGLSVFAAAAGARGSAGRAPPERRAEVGGRQDGSRGQRRTAAGRHQRSRQPARAPRGDLSASRELSLSRFAALPEIIERFAPLARAYDVLLCDVWGVVHNGVAAFPAACDALQRFRAGGGTVILITNAPRPGASVRDITRPARACRATATTPSSVPAMSPAASSRAGRVSAYSISGRSAICRFSRGSISAFAPASRAPIMWSAPGLFDDTGETPEDYRAAAWRRCARARCSWSAPIPISWSSAATNSSIARARSRTPMPRWAARCSIAASRMRRFTESALGSAAARCAAACRRRSTRVLAIGDSVRTDLKGAAACSASIACSSISGIHADRLGGRERAGSFRPVRRSSAPPAWRRRR